MVRVDPGDAWEAVVADADAVATTYRDQGWTVATTHPGHVNPVTDAARIDVLLPDPEFETAHETVATANLDAVDVYAAAEAGVAYRVVVATDESAAVAVSVPTYLSTTALRALGAAADAVGSLTVRLRPLDDRTHAEIVIDGVQRFVDPPASAVSSHE
jgi:hypothetical protein